MWRRDRSLPLRTHLFRFALICFVPAIVAAAYFAYQLGNREQLRVEEQASVLSSNFQSGIDSIIQSSARVLEALAQTNSLRSGRWQDFQAIAEAVAASNEVAITVRTSDGQHLVNSLIPFGTRPLPKTMDPVLREADKRAIAGGKPVVSDVYVGATTHLPYVAVVYPVTLGTQVRYLLTMAFPTSRIGSALQLGSLADARWSASVMGSDGRLVARTRNPEAFVGSPGSDVLRHAAATASSGTLFSRTLDGVDVFTTFQNTVHGWTVVVSAPVAAIHAPVRHLIIGTILISLSVVALTAIGAWWYGKRLGGEVAVLGENALALGDDRPFKLNTQHIQEVADAQRAIFEAREKIYELLNELNHRVKNTLAIVTSVASRSAADPDARRRIAGRIGALARAHDVLSDSVWRGADLCKLVTTIAKAEDVPLACDGPEIVLSAKATVAVAQALQELMSNAKQHGSLRSGLGTVSVRWRAENSVLLLIWEESSPEPFADGALSGFGTQIIELSLKRTLNGSFSIDRRSEGWIIVLQIPFSSELGVAATPLMKVTENSGVIGTS